MALTACITVATDSEIKEIVGITILHASKRR